VEKQPVTVQCPICDAQHPIRIAGAMNIIECPRVPPNMIYGVDPALWRRQPDT